jgi:hypothetical protein
MLNGRGRRAKRFRGKVVDSLGGVSHTCQDDCFLAFTDDGLQTTCPTIGLGLWVCLLVRGAALMVSGHLKKDAWFTRPSKKRVCISVNLLRKSFFGREKESVGAEGYVF